MRTNTDLKLTCEESFVLYHALKTYPKVLRYYLEHAGGQEIPDNWDEIITNIDSIFEKLGAFKDA
jgi:hypothetical protein